MRCLAALFATFVLAACSKTPVTRNESQDVSPTQAIASEMQKASMDSVVRFLLTAAATDFHTHRPADPVRFRDVRIGHVMTPSGEEKYILCGQFLPAHEGGKAEWTPFATIKTSGYEQWIGSSCKLLPGHVGHMGQGGRFVLIAAEPIRFSAIRYRELLPHGCERCELRSKG